jgi:hypothetical protein
LNAGDRRVLREARTEAVVVLLLDVALLVGLAVADKAKGWSIVDLPCWAWLLHAARPTPCRSRVGRRGVMAAESLVSPTSW